MYICILIDEVENAQVVDTLQTELVVMLGSCSPKVSSASDQETVESPQAPHHSLVHIENQSDLQISHPTLESHNPITHALEESYVANHVAKQKLSSFCMFSRLSISKECTCLSSAHNLIQHYGTSIECLSCAFTLFFSVDVSKLRLCWFTLIYLSCLLFCVNIFLVNHAFTYMCQNMHQWLH